MTKVQTNVTIEDILRESGLYWSLSYSTSTDSYNIFISDEDTSDVCENEKSIITTLFNRISMDASSEKGEK